MTFTTTEPCNSPETCDQPTHEFPNPGVYVAVLKEVKTRRPGDDTETQVTVSAGSIGVVEGYVAEWFHVDVRLRSGTNVWISPDNLLVLELLTKEAM